MIFELFDPQGELRIAEGNSLPHWFQPGVTYFITFRTEDSIPVDLTRQWHWRRDDWLRRHAIDPATANWKAALAALPREARLVFHETFSQEFLDHLDKGHGACVLRRSELAQLVAESLKYFDGQRYYLGDFVVMPNHVLLLVCLLGDTDVEEQCYSWKKYTATRINRLLGQKGRFWQEESFDHLVRTAEQLAAIQQYIAENPARARLQEGEYDYWRRP